MAGAGAVRAKDVASPDAAARLVVSTAATPFATADPGPTPAARTAAVVLPPWPSTRLSVPNGPPGPESPVPAVSDASTRGADGPWPTALAFKLS
jgi:hypothetical protein